ncbi:hypothetical protein [Fortiea contorta]|nr:hypothetical protein [Fortiea contorta]
MRQIRLIIIGLISFLSIAAGSWFHRAIAISLCGVLGINSPACYVLGYL